MYNLRKRKKIDYRETRRYRQTIKLNSLNDDCLLTVLDLLTTDDLANVYYTCRRFADLASTSFRLRYKGTYFGLTKSLPTTNFRIEQYGRFTDKINVKALTAFRKEIKCVIIQYSMPPDIINHFNKICYETLEELVICDCQYDFLQVAVHKPFVNVKKLTYLPFVRLDGFDVVTTKFSVLFSNVEHLVLTKAFIFQMKQFCKCFSKLKVFELYRTELSDEELNAFQRQYPRVTVNIMGSQFPPASRW